MGMAGFRRLRQVTLRFTGTLDRAAVAEAAAIIGMLVRHPEVAAAWSRESSCEGMTVGGLTRHLVGQPVNVVALLRANQEPLHPGGVQPRGRSRPRAGCGSPRPGPRRP
jgi:hypothetical protein